MFRFIYRWSTTIFAGIYALAAGFPLWASVACIAAAVAVDIFVVTKAHDLNQPLDEIATYVRGEKPLAPPPSPRPTLLYAAALIAIIAWILFQAPSVRPAAHCAMLFAATPFLVFWNFELRAAPAALIYTERRGGYGQEWTETIDYVALSRAPMRGMYSFFGDNPIFYVPILLFLAYAVVFFGKELGVDPAADEGGFLLTVAGFLAILIHAHSSCVFWRYKAVAIAFAKEDRGRRAWRKARDGAKEPPPHA